MLNTLTIGRGVHAWKGAFSLGVPKMPKAEATELMKCKHSLGDKSQYMLMYNSPFMFSYDIFCGGVLGCNNSFGTRNGYLK